MWKLLRIMKRKLFGYLVESHPVILRKYVDYRQNNAGTHEKHRYLTWVYVFIWNFNYRVLRKKVNENFVGGRKSGRTNHQTRPALRGPESNSYNRPAPQHFAKQFLDYDVISFDIFDTLILRPFSDPNDLFLFLENKFDYINLAKLREKYEQEVRRRVEEQTNGNSREVTIEQIYEELSKWTGIDKQQGIEAEYNLELEFCFANPYMKIVFDILKANNKRIIAVSDMYLPKPMMERLLRKCGYEGFEEIFVSCDYGVSKRNLGLYNVVEEKLTKGLRVIHVGDNFVPDIEKAIEAGWEAVHYRNVHHIGNKFRPTGMSKLIHTAYSGIANTHLHNGSTAVFNPYYEFGFLYGGLFSVGFSNYIHEYAEKHGVEKILFLSRDGAVLKKAYDHIYGDKAVDNEYVFWSRNPSRMIASRKYKYDYLNQYVEIKANGTYILEDVISAMDLRFILDRLEMYELSSTEYLTSENKGNLIKLLTDNWVEIQDHYSKSAEAIRKYLKPIIGDAKKIGVVDIGWHGTSIMGIRAVINDVLGMNCEVHGLMVATSSKNPDHITSLLMSRKINAYMFSPLENRNYLFSHRSRSENNVLMELFCTAAHPSVLAFRLDNDGELVLDFDIPEVENYEIINEVQRGMLDFVEKYTETFKEYDYMFRVSGLDAYQPVKHIFTDLTYIRKFFGHYSYNRLLGNQKRRHMTTINDILRKTR